MDNFDKKICPMCGEEILAVAKKCKHCGEYLAEKPKSRTIYLLLGFFFGMLGIHNFYAKEYTSGGIKLFLSIASAIFIVGGIEFGMGMFGVLWVWGLIDIFRFNPDRPASNINSRAVYCAVTAGEAAAWIFAALFILGGVMSLLLKGKPESIASLVPTVIIATISAAFGISMERTRRKIKKRAILVKR